MTNTTNDPETASRPSGGGWRLVAFFAPITAASTVAQTSDQPADGSVDYASLFKQLETDGNVPNASVEVIDPSHAIFQAMYLDLGVLKQKLIASGLNPPVVTVYADLLSVPTDLKWSLADAGLVV